MKKSILAVSLICGLATASYGQKEKIPLPKNNPTLQKAETQTLLNEEQYKEYKEKLIWHTQQLYCFGPNAQNLIGSSIKGVEKLCGRPEKQSQHMTANGTYTVYYYTYAGIRYSIFYFANDVVQRASVY